MIDLTTTNGINWTGALAVPGGLEVILSDGLPMTETTIDVFSDAYPSYVGALSLEGASDRQLRGLARAGMELTKLRAQSNGDGQARFLHLLQEIARELRKVHGNGTSLFAPKSQAFGKQKYIPRQVPRILDHLDDTQLAVNTTLIRLDTRIARVKTRVARLRHDVQARQRDRGAARRWLGVSPRELRRDFAREKRILSQRIEERRELAQLESELKFLAALIHSDQNANLVPTARRILSNGMFYSLFRDERILLQRELNLIVQR